MPWKNGLGVTREIAREPSSGDFDWRLSLASMPVEAEFSPFPGVDRRLGVVDGGELEIQIADRVERVAVGGVPVVFGGMDVVVARPLGEPVTDLNLMSKNESHVGSLDAVTAGRYESTAPLVFVVALVDGLTVDAAGERSTLRRLDTFLGSADVVLGAPMPGVVAYLGSVASRAIVRQP